MDKTKGSEKKITEVGDWPDVNVSQYEMEGRI